MPKGKVKWYNDIKGYGFIESETGEDIFIHRSDLDKSYLGLEQGQLVEFEIKKGHKGLAACNVKFL